MEKISLVKNTIDKDDIDNLIDWLKTYPRLTKGPVTLELEKKFSDWLGENILFLSIQVPLPTY